MPLAKISCDCRNIIISYSESVNLSVLSKSFQSYRENIFRQEVKALLAERHKYDIQVQGIKRVRVHGRCAVPCRYG